MIEVQIKAVDGKNIKADSGLPNVAKQEERDEGGAGEGKCEGGETARPGGSRPLDEAGRHPAQQVAHVVQQETPDRNEVFLPGLVLAGGHRQYWNGREDSQGDKVDKEHGKVKRPGLADYLREVDILANITDIKKSQISK